MFALACGCEELRGAADALLPGRHVALSGMWGSSSALAAAVLGRLSGRTVLFVTTHLDDADEVIDDLELFSSRSVQLFPAWEASLREDHVSQEITAERVNICTLLSKPPSDRSVSVDFIVAPIMALLQPVPTRDALTAGKLTCRRGDDMPPEQLIEWLVDAEFENVEQVDQPGQFARRGGIVDVFPMGSTQAVRLEFFGDEIDSIRRFNLDTQRSSDQLDHVDITSPTTGLDSAAGEMALLTEYLPPDAIVCMVEPAEVQDLADNLYRRVTAAAKDHATREAMKLRGADDDDQPSEAVGLCNPDDVFSAIDRFACAEMHTFKAPRGAEKNFDMGVRSLQKLSLNTREALAELSDLTDVAEVWIHCENDAERDRFLEMMKSSHKKLARCVHIELGHVSSGFYWPGQKLVVVGHHEVFRRYTKVRKIRKVRATRAIDTLLDLQCGDYVVHVAHGIARFDGLRPIEKDGRREEYLSLRFSSDAVLHVPTSQINLVQKYIGSGKHRPRLSTLGGNMWGRQKERVMEAVRDMAADMIRTQAMRESIEGNSYPESTKWQQEFCDEFLYTETEDQVTAMQQIDADMVSAQPMDRLLCGDVGFGKTELAMRAAFKAAEAGKQVAVLVPTTVLADQHYRTFTERFADYPFEIEVLSRFRTAADQTKIISRLRRSKIDILIGTHRILSEDVRYGDLGLVVIDEEQRFGVEHKERLKSLRASVEVLTLTATPIPRTLHLALLGLRDISSLATPPMDRRAIHTEVCHWDAELIRTAIERELNRGGQVFLVHNRVQNIESVVSLVQSLVPDARVDYGHGQMGERGLEAVMGRFIRHEIDVLVCTTIIESGLDIPSANTMIIQDSDRFGLSALHQLRGRVGRYKHRAYCYLLMPQHRPVSTDAAKRLKAIEDFSDLGSGFQIAMRDLEIRGAGNILGKEQSGHIAIVGYELYCQLLEDEVRSLKGQPKEQRIAMHVELGIDTYIPKDYIPSQRLRMETYRRVVACKTPADIRQLSADLVDVYGKAPEEIDTLMDIVEVRVLAAAMGIRSIILKHPDLILDIPDTSKTNKLFEGSAGTVRLADGHTVHWRLPPAYLEMPTLLRVLLTRLRKASPPGAKA